MMRESSRGHDDEAKDKIPTRIFHHHRLFDDNLTYSHYVLAEEAFIQ